MGAHVGIDISSWNNEIDWDALKEQNIEFVMIRVGYGESDTDKRFVENIEGAIANDMPFGVYYYSYAKDTAKAGREAAYCLKQLEPYKEYLTLPVAYDLEEYERPFRRAAGGHRRNVLHGGAGRGPERHGVCQRQFLLQNGLCLL